MKKKMWDINYELVKKYYMEHGNIDIPANFIYEGKNIGSWLVNQKSAYRGVGKHKITEEEIAKLNELGIVWSKRENKWMRNYELLKKYYLEHGDTLIPDNYIVDGVNLSSWVTTQRKAYNKTGKVIITNEQIDLLNEINMVWNKFDDNWNTCYKLLEEYYQKHGNIDIHYSYSVNGIKLGLWISTQRKAYNNKNDHTMTQDRIDKLNRLGMKWDKRKSDWYDYYNLLVEYYMEHGNIDVPVELIYKGMKLGLWISIQRQIYKGTYKGYLNDHQIKLLNKLGMKWDKWEDDWNEYYNILKEYYIKHENIDIKSGEIINGKNIGIWLASQRQIYRGNSKSKLSEEKIAKLEKLGIKWYLNNEIAWIDYYSLLILYKEKYGNINVPWNYVVDGINLGTWLINQRKAYKGSDNHKLTEEKIRLLNELGIDWNINETKYLNRKISDIEIYNIKLFNRTNLVLRDLILEGINEIDQEKTQKEIEKIMIKRIWR